MSSVPIPPLIPPPAFSVIRGRSLIWRWLLANIFAGVVVVAAFGIDVSAGEGLAFAVASVLSNAVFLLLIWRLVRRAKLRLAALVGSAPSLKGLKQYAAVPILLFGTSYISFFLFYLPFFYFFPNIVESWWKAMMLPEMISTTGNWYWLGNLFNLVFVVGVAPVVEEFVFRGLLLTRWSRKWGISRGILASSLLFGIAHGNLLGMVFFAIVMSILYIETRSLVVPIVRARFKQRNCLASRPARHFVGFAGIHEQGILRGSTRHGVPRGCAIPALGNLLPGPPFQALEVHHAVR